VGVHDNFFELGGDSFIAIRMASELRRELGRDIQVAKLYQGLTVRSLAHLLAAEKEEDERRAQLLSERQESMGRRRELQQSRRAGKKSREVTHG
jgi:aryl carrier-like protein